MLMPLSNLCKFQHFQADNSKMRTQSRQGRDGVLFSGKVAFIYGQFRTVSEGGSWLFNSNPRNVGYFYHDNRRGLPLNQPKNGDK